jgi:Protein of unknown function (DUF2997)
MNRTIEVIIDAKGRTTVQTKGFSGPECREASRSFEAALGVRVSETATAEFHQQGLSTPQEVRQPE